MSRPLGRPLGHPRVHLRTTSSTNDHARALAIAGAPHGTLVTASEQTAGRGRQGRSWAAPFGSALLMSLILRDPPSPLSLIAGVAVCDAVGAEAAIKWPNDVVLAPPAAGSPGAPARPLAKLGGILVEGRPQEGWAVLGVGLNAAVDVDELPVDVRMRAASLGRDPAAIEPLLAAILGALSERLAAPTEHTLDAWRERDALHGRQVSWAGSTRAGSTRADENVAHGVAEGIDDEGRLLVRRGDGALTALDAGEVHLTPAG